MAITINDFYNALGLTNDNGTATLINMIRNSYGSIADVTGEVTNAEELKDFGVALEQNPQAMNQFISTLVNRIGGTVLKHKSLTNPLKRFKKQNMEYGDTLQEIYIDLIQAQSFNPEDAEQTLFRREKPDVRVMYHHTWRKELYKTTIEQTTIKHAFVSFERFNSFLLGIYNSLYNSNEVDEFLWTKSIMESYVSNGYATIVEVEKPDNQTRTRDFTKKVRTMVDNMVLQQGSRNYNGAGVHTRTEPGDVWLIMTTELKNNIDVESLATAYNMDKVKLNSQIITVESFGVDGLEAIAFDGDIFQIHDKEFRTNEVYNPQGLYYNVFLHAHTLFSLSKFNNFVAFMSSATPPLQRLTVNPFSDYIPVNADKVLTGNYVLSKGHTMDEVTLTVKVTDANGSTISSGVTTFISDKTSTGFKVNVKVTDDTLVNQELHVVVTGKTGTEETSDLKEISANVILVPTMPNTPR